MEATIIILPAIYYLFPAAAYKTEALLISLISRNREERADIFEPSNHKPMQIELLKKYVRQDIIVDHLSFSIPSSNLVDNGMEGNMESAGLADRYGSVLDYCWISDITIQV